MEASSRAHDRAYYYSEPGQVQPEYQTSPPTPPRPRSQPHRRKKPIGPMRKYSRENFYFRLFIIGIFFMIAGYVVTSSTGYMDPPERDDYDDDNDDYEDALDFYYDLKDGLTTTGKIFEHVGIIVLILALFIGAVVDEKLPVYVRVGMIVTIGLIAAFGI